MAGQASGLRRLESYLQTHDRLDAGLSRRPAEPHDPTQVVVIRQRQRLDAELHRLSNQDFRRGGAV
jgi:hypothetical protein